MKKQSYSPEEIQDISIRLEGYDDIFSDFDMRPFESRALSVDFLDEIKRAVSGKDGDGVELILHVPENKRDGASEANVKKRLNAHCTRHYELLTDEKHRVMKLGVSMVILGTIAMILATFIMFEDPTQNLLLSFLVVFLEPSAWFLLWEGMEQIIFNSKKINPELNFYRTMFEAKERILFESI
jgi:hypothetical protein